VEANIKRFFTKIHILFIVYIQIQLNFLLDNCHFELGVFVSPPPKICDVAQIAIIHKMI
jgi:hypothetical protein